MWDDDERSASHYIPSYASKIYNDEVDIVKTLHQGHCFDCQIYDRYIDLSLFDHFYEDDDQREDNYDQEEDIEEEVELSHVEEVEPVEGFFDNLNMYKNIYYI